MATRPLWRNTEARRVRRKALSVAPRLVTQRASGAARGSTLASGSLQRRLRGASVRVALPGVQARQVVSAGRLLVVAHAPRHVKRRGRDDAAAQQEDAHRASRRARLRRKRQRGGNEGKSREAGVCGEMGALQRVSPRARPHALRERRRGRSADVAARRAARGVAQARSQRNKRPVRTTQARAACSGTLRRLSLRNAGLHVTSCHCAQPRRGAPRRAARARRRRARSRLPSSCRSRDRRAAARGRAARAPGEEAGRDAGARSFARRCAANRAPAGRCCPRAL